MLEAANPGRLIAGFGELSTEGLEKDGRLYISVIIKTLGALGGGGGRLSTLTGPKAAGSACDGGEKGNRADLSG